MNQLSSTSPTRAEGLITVQLGKELKTQWVNWCSERDLVPGKALRKLVDKALVEGLELGVSEGGKRIRVIVGKTPDTGPKIDREMRFTPSEDAAITAAAAAQGFGFQEWVIAATRAALAKAPSYGQAELEELTRSNKHLAQLVAELAALRRAEALPKLADHLAMMEADVRAHVEVVSAAMAQGVQRWQLKL
jgi:hypothetical protein